MSRKRRGLSEEDREIWEAVKKTAKPLHVKQRVMETAPQPIDKPLKRDVKTPPEDRFDPLDIGSKAAQTPMGHDIAPSISERLSYAPLRMDRKKHGKMSKGKLKPEARIDLHGMTLDQAHPSLVRFIMGSFAEQRRLVLVITGKGKHRDDGGPIPTRVGILKHQVPHWLHLPPCRDVILNVSQAHLKHGGAGAYYVYLKRPK